MSTLDELVERWAGVESAFAFLPADRSAIVATKGPRALIVERLLGHAPDADLFHACAILGRHLAERGASPTLAASAVDAARQALPTFDDATARAARAALAEGFNAARDEMALAQAAARWEYPGCVVPLEDAAIAISAGYPEDDEDALAAWAARVANQVARTGYRRAIVAGGDKAVRQVVDALELAGVKVRTTSPPAPLGKR
jgi:uncharacterized protein YgbK (DUF1537 family)